MLECKCVLDSISPISFSKPIQSVKNIGEAHDAFEERTWRERLHVDKVKNVFIPPMNLKNCLSEVAKYLSETVPGKKSATYTKHFEAGIMVVQPMPLSANGNQIILADVEGERLFVPSDGQRGGGKRVWKTFPLIPEWHTTAQVLVLDPILIDKPEKIEEYLQYAGQFIGMGRFRPRNNGYYGRFKVSKFTHSKVK